jgi:hypothetical protein
MQAQDIGTLRKNMGIPDDAGSTYGSEQIERFQATTQKMDLQGL